MLAFARSSTLARVLATMVAGAFAVLSVGPSQAQTPPAPPVKPIPRKPPTELAPSAPTNLVAAQLPTIHCERVVGLRFGCSTGSSAIARYVVMRNGAAVDYVDATTACPTGPGGDGSITTANLAGDGTSTYRLYSEDAKGGKSALSGKATVLVSTDGTPCSYPGKPTEPALCVSGKCELQKP